MGTKTIVEVLRIAIIGIFGTYILFSIVSDLIAEQNFSLPIQIGMFSIVGLMIYATRKEIMKLIAG